MRSVFSRGRGGSCSGNEAAGGAHRRGKNGAAREAEARRGIQRADTDQGVEGVQEHGGQTGAESERFHPAR